MKAMAPDIHSRYQRAGELLEDVLAARSSTSSADAATALSGPSAASETEGAEDIQTAAQGARNAAAPRFCWHCRKPLHARADRCPFCGEGAIQLASRQSQFTNSPIS